MSMARLLRRENEHRDARAWADLFQGNMALGWHRIDPLILGAVKNHKNNVKQKIVAFLLDNISEPFEEKSEMPTRSLAYEREMNTKALDPSKELRSHHRW